MAAPDQAVAGARALGSAGPARTWTDRVPPIGRELAAALAWGVAAYLLTSVRIELPGPAAFHTDLTEVALLGSALFLARPWLTLIACAIEALNVVPPATLALSFETTFLMHAVAVPCAWYAHRALARRQLSHLALGLGWCLFVVGYYLVLLIPMLIATTPFIPASRSPPLAAGEVLSSYLRVVRAVPYEILLTASITALTFVTKEELRRRRRTEAMLREALEAQRAHLREQLALRAEVQRSATMSALGQLVGGVAHELRNPLFGITASLDAFGPQLAGHPRLAQLDRTLRGQVGQLEALMVGLLDYGKAGGSDERTPASLELPMHHALVDCAGQAAAAGATLDVLLPAGLPRVPMDAMGLVQVFRNLIQNALAFSPAGSAVRIEGALERDGARELVRIDVLDRGKGFELDDLPRVFEPFFSRRSGGTGLGLAIVRRIVEQHGGTVEAANRDGGGAAMTVRLPAA